LIQYFQLGSRVDPCSERRAALMCSSLYNTPTTETEPDQAQIQHARNLFKLTAEATFFRTALDGSDLFLHWTCKHVGEK